MKSLIMAARSTILLLLVSLFLASSVYAQAMDRPPREFTNPEEMISFDRSTSFADAIEVLNNYSNQFENRLLLDRTGTTDAIGVSLPPMHWRDALNYLMRVKNLVILESPDMLEIVTREEAERVDAPERDRVDPRAPDEVQISTKTREVRINATFFEGDRRALREIGVDWSTLTNNVPANVREFVSDAGSETLPETEFGNQFVSVNTTGAQNVSQNVFNSLINLGELGGGISVQALFSAFEADNLGKILATPSIKVMDGEEGRIQVGQDFSIKQRDFAGNVTDQFFSTGTILFVTPQVIEYGDTTLIYLDLQAERSSAQPDPVSTVINKQEANTHALLLDGESTVIAGLYRTERAEIRRGVPILKDLPGWFFGLKYLFGYNSTDIQESELVVILQAELEEPIESRIARAFQSQGQLLTSAQQRHRDQMTYISPKSPVPPVPETEPAIEVPQPDVDLGTDIPEEPVEEPVPEPEVPEEVVTPEPEEVEMTPEMRRELFERYELRPFDLDQLRPHAERRMLTEAELDRMALNDYAGEWRPMVLENMNGDNDLRFYVIGGSFQVWSNAERLYNSFIDEGLDAHILHNPVTDFYFVAYAGFRNPDPAIEYLRDIQRNRQAEAWLSRLIREERRLDVDE